MEFSTRDFWASEAKFQERRCCMYSTNITNDHNSSCCQLSHCSHYCCHWQCHLLHHHPPPKLMPTPLPLCIATSAIVASITWHHNGYQCHHYHHCTASNRVDHNPLDQYWLDFDGRADSVGRLNQAIDFELTTLWSWAMLNWQRPVNSGSTCRVYGKCPGCSFYCRIKHPGFFY